MGVPSHLKSTCERLEPRSHFISKLNMIVRVRVVLNMTVDNSERRFKNLCGSHLLRQSELYHIKCNLRSGPILAVLIHSL